MRQLPPFADLCIWSSPTGAASPMHGIFKTDGIQAVMSMGCPRLYPGPACYLHEAKRLCRALRACEAGRKGRGEGTIHLPVAPVLSPIAKHCGHEPIAEKVLCAVVVPVGLFICCRPRLFFSLQCVSDFLVNVQPPPERDWRWLAAADAPCRLQSTAPQFQT